MGQEIEKVEFGQPDFARFTEHLQAEMELLRTWFGEEKFCDDALQCGLELEAWLIGKDGLPAPDNTLFLKALDRDWVVPELSKFNFEVNVSPKYARGAGLSDMRSELAATWGRCEKVADKLGHRIVSTGILPTVTDSMLCVENMSQSPRYAALNEQVIKLRSGRPVVLEIEGEDRLRSEHHDLMLESAATSLQVHVKVPPRFSVRFYNASMIASAFTVALASNAPLLFNRRLWHDTRIAVFEQAVDTCGRKPRVSFGDRYIQTSLLELFEINFEMHRVLLPAEQQRPPAMMPYVRMHNGTIWNWNRPLIGFESDGTPHLRVEHRPMSASPTIRDLFADVTFYFGFACLLARLSVPPEQRLSIATAQKNFYAAARYGLEAKVQWLDGQVVSLRELLRAHIVQDAFDEAAAQGIDSELVEDCRRIIEARVQTGQTGAVWQRRKHLELSRDAARVLQEYAANQMIGEPVHTWS